MKLNRISHIAASMFIAVVAALMPVDMRAETPHAASGSSEWIVPVFLPDISAIPELYTDNWLDLADLPASDRPESDYQGFRLPHINAVYTRHKSVIESLTAKCSVILIDYKESTPADFSALPVDSIVAIGICGPQARVVTTSALTPGSNPALVSADLMEFVALAKAAGYSASAGTKEERRVLVDPHVKPYYLNGGAQGLQADLYSTLSKTAPATQDCVKGRAVVSFIIKKDGSIDPGSIKVVRNKSVPADYIAAAIEAIKGLGKFEPGKMNGTPANVTWNQPIAYPVPADYVRADE